MWHPHFSTIAYAFARFQQGLKINPFMQLQSHQTSSRRLGLLPGTLRPTLGSPLIHASALSRLVHHNFSCWITAQSSLPAPSLPSSRFAPPKQRRMSRQPSRIEAEIMVFCDRAASITEKRQVIHDLVEIENQHENVFV